MKKTTQVQMCGGGWMGKGSLSLRHGKPLVLKSGGGSPAKEKSEQVEG